MRSDKIITCQQCYQSFVWTEEEQVFYQTKGWQPNRCPICRAAHKEAVKDNFRGKLTKLD